IYNRYSAHYIFIPNVGYVSHCMICIGGGGIVVDIQPFYSETESTEWCQGVIILHYEGYCNIKELMLISDRNKLQYSDVCERIDFVKEKGYRATLLSSFDFSTMTPCDGTQRTLLR
ncbi:MAG: hypothetical protein Q3992_01915, partial [Bacteroides sp.]|nr:hypothetical protein [Bacteroides sp.]